MAKLNVNSPLKSENVMSTFLEMLGLPHDTECDDLVITLKPGQHVQYSMTVPAIGKHWEKNIEAAALARKS